MGFLAKLFQWLFGGGKKTEPPAPAPTPAPVPRKEAPPPSPAPTPRPIELDSLRAQNPARLTAEQIAASAAALGVEPEALRAIAQVESAGQGFGADGRILIMFDAAAFAQLAGAAAPAGAGNSQAERWARLTAAYAVNADAALQATNFGVFQLSGASYSAAGYPSVFALAADLAQSEARQLAAFEQFMRAADLMDELRNHDWAAFAHTYHPATDAARYAAAVQNAFNTLKPAPAVGADNAFLASLVAKNPAPLSDADVAASAQRLGCEPACVRAVLKVESNGGGFGPDGRPKILYEPHVFSRLTGHQYDQSHPKISYLNWKTLPYPKTQAERYAQVAEAYQLDPEAAVAAASWGLFQILGSNHQACGFSTAQAFVADMAQSEVRMLVAFENFITNNNLLTALRGKDWRTFASKYNGPGQVDTYAGLLEKAYNSASASA